MRYLRKVAANELPERLLALAAAASADRGARGHPRSADALGLVLLHRLHLAQLASRADARTTVRDYVLLHELMHLREPNHSRRFWRHVATVCPDFQQSRRWLRTHESLLALRER